ncbi:MAG: c-type cytochrome [Gemmatimonadota bacterium]
MKFRGTALLPALLIAVLGACGPGGGADAGGAGDAGSEPATDQPEVSSDLPVSAPTGAIDPTLAQRGEELFQTRGCVACHKIGGGKLVGPDLAGVTERRSFPWIYHMITNPDSMVANDSTAKRLLGELLVPMPNQGVQPDEVPALYEMLRRGPTAQDAPAASGGHH